MKLRHLFLQLLAVGLVHGQKISELAPIDGADVDPAADVLPLVDTSGTITKKITVADLFKATTYSATAYGAGPAESAANNTARIQAALDAAAASGGGRVLLDAAGTYNLNATLTIASDVSLEGVPGVVLNKAVNYGEVLANEGAYTRIADSRITLRNLDIDCSGGNVIEAIQPGLRGHVSFFHVNGFTIENVRLLNMPANQFGFHLCTVTDGIVRNCYVEGEKDAYHLADAARISFIGCEAETEDDAFALNAIDWVDAIPRLGDIEDISIIDCRDLYRAGQTGNFIRAPGGAWTAWSNGASYYQNDTVTQGGYIYRSTTPGPVTASTAPSGTTIGGTETGADGITWRCDQQSTRTSANVKRVKIIGCEMLGARPALLPGLVSSNSDNRGTTPGQEANVVTSDLTFIGCRFKPQTAQVFAQSTGYVDSIRFIGCTFDNYTYLWSGVTKLAAATLPARNTSMTFEGCVFTSPPTSTYLVSCLTENTGAVIRASGSVYSGAGIYRVVGSSGATTRVPYSDLPIHASDLDYQTTGDRVIGTDGIWRTFQSTFPLLENRERLSGHVRDLMLNPTLGNIGVSAATSTRSNIWVQLYPGTAATGWARATLSTMGTLRPASGINFSVPFRLITTHTLGCNNGNFVRLIYGDDNSLATPATSAANALGRKGLGYECRRNGANYEVRLFSHNGTTYQTSAWHDLGAASSSSPYSFCTYADGFGNVSLWAQVGSSGIGQLGLFVGAPAVTLSGGPTGSAGAATDNAVTIQTIADGTTSGGGAGTFQLVEARLMYEPN